MIYITIYITVRGTNMEGEHFTLTQAGFRELQAQLNELNDLRQRAITDLDDVDEDTGNLEGEEAGAFFDAKTRVERLGQRIGHIQFVLERAQVVEDDPDPTRVDPGERVTVWDFVEQRERTFDLVSSPEAELTYNRDFENRKVSMASPVGQALLGKQIGDVIEVDVPDGKTRYAIRRIEHLSQ
jgi:transcription elongation factor GreA